MNKLIPVIAFLVCAVSLQTNAQVKRDECRRAGTIIDEQFSHQSSDEPTVSISFDSNSKPAISKEGRVSITTYDVYKRQSCQLTEYSRTVRKCKKVPKEEVGSGKGNDQYRKIINNDLYHNERVRAVLISMSFSANKEQRARRADAATLVDVITIAKNNNIEGPMTWEKIKREALNLIPARISQPLFDDAFINNSRKNKQSLGFVNRYPDAQIVEGTGNADYDDLFNDNIDLESRMAIVRDVLHNIRLNRRQVRAIARGFEDYGLDFDIPNNWNDVTVMLRHIINASNELPTSLHREMTVTYEQDTREGLGFDISAQVCSNRTITDDYNKVVHSTVPKKNKTERVSYRMNVSGISLIKGESETVEVKLSSLTRPKLTSNGRYHSLSLATPGIQDNFVGLRVSAQRVKKDVQNTLSVTQLSRQRNTNLFTLSVVDSAHDARIGGRSFVEVHVFERKLIGKNIQKQVNRKIVQLDKNGKATIEMDVAMDKSKRSIYAKYKIIRKGSAYIKDGSSSTITTKRLKRK